MIPQTKNFLLAVLLILTCFGCSKEEPPARVLTPQEQNERVVDRHCHKVGQKLAKKHDMFFNGGSGCTHPWGYNPKQIDFSYQVFRPFTKEEARILIWDCIKMAIKEFNENPEMQAYIPEGGYKIRNISFSITINPNKEFVFHPQLGEVSSFLGKIWYSTLDPDKDFIITKSREKETLEEALAQLSLLQ